MSSFVGVRHKNSSPQLDNSSHVDSSLVPAAPSLKSLSDLVTSVLLHSSVMLSVAFLFLQSLASTSDDDTEAFTAASFLSLPLVCLPVLQLWSFLGDASLHEITAS